MTTKSELETLKPRPHKAYHTLNTEMKQLFGRKIVKLSLDGGFDCPNRDGTISTQGCIFCSDAGSGDFAGDRQSPFISKSIELDVTAHTAHTTHTIPTTPTPNTFTGLRSVTSLQDQIASQKQLLMDKWPHAAYMAYFQNFTNTYAPVCVLKSLYEQVLQDDDIVGIAIATRPDALSPEVLDYLAELNQKTFLWVELGLQTTNDKKAAFINRGYDLALFEKSHQALKDRGIRTVIHLIVGLPDPALYKDEHDSADLCTNLASDLSADLPANQSDADSSFCDEDFVQSMALMNVYQPWGLKIHLLHVLKHTQLHQLYQQRPFPLPDCDAYLNLLVKTLEQLNPNIVIHRVTGDAPKALMVAPWWSLNKRAILNGLDRVFRERNSWQGKFYTPTQP